MYRKVGKAIVWVVCLLFQSMAVAGCAMLSGETSVTTPKTGPGTDYPCGVNGVLCTDQAAKITPDQSCCYPHSTCKMDNDGPYCESYDFDPADPVNMLKKNGAKPKRKLRFARHAS